MAKRLLTVLYATLLTSALAAPALAQSITVEDSYARASRTNAPVGAAFMTITNSGDEDDRLISATSDAAPRVELHTHLMDTNGVARMVEVEDGILVPAGSSHKLMRGGDHIMLMGLTESLEQGGEITVTLTFENAGDVNLTVPVDNERQPAHHGHGSHGN